MAGEELSMVDRQRCQLCRRPDAVVAPEEKSTSGVKLNRERASREILITNFESYVTL